MINKFTDKKECTLFPWNVTF